MLLEPDPKSADLFAALGGTARDKKCYNSRFIQGGPGVGCLQPIGGKADMDPAFGLDGLKDRVGRVLHQFLQLKIGVSA